MRTKGAWLIVLAALSGLACGDEQPTQSPQTKDAAASPSDSLTAKDLPTPDTAFAADRADDKKQPTTDTFVAPALDVATADRPLADVVADSAKTDAPDEPAPIDSAIDTGTKDVSVEASIKDAPIADTAAAVASFPCRNDSDCCIAVDSCMAMAYLYSKGPGGAGPPTMPVHNPGDGCLPCIPPAVQVRCVAGQCTGEKLSTYSSSSSLTSAHCGTIAIPDGGTYALYLSIDGGSPVPVKTTWSCGS